MCVRALCRSSLRASRCRRAVAPRWGRRWQWYSRALTHVRAGQSAAREVDLSVERLFYYAAYADKFGGTIQAKMPAARPAAP
jgi:hypothetical protein